MRELGRIGGRAKTPAKLAAAGRAALVHGRRSTKHFSPAQIRNELLRKIHPDAPEIIAAAIAAVAGDFEPYELVGAQALAEAEILRRAGVDAIQKKGILVKETRTEIDGSVVERWKANPLLDLGPTASRM